MNVVGENPTNDDVEHRQRLSVVEAMLKAMDHGAEIVRLVSSSYAEDCEAALQEKYGFSREQTGSVMTMQVRYFSRFYRQRLEEERRLLMEQLGNE